MMTANSEFARDTYMISEFLSNLATVRTDQGRYEEAGALFSRALPLFKRRLGDSSVAAVIQGMGELDLQTGNYEEALERFREAKCARSGNIGMRQPVLRRHPDQTGAGVRGAGVIRPVDSTFREGARDSSRAVRPGSQRGHRLCCGHRGRPDGSR